MAAVRGDCFVAIPRVRPAGRLVQSRAGLDQAENYAIKPIDPTRFPQLELRGRTRSPASLLGQFLLCLGVVACIAESVLPQLKNADGSKTSTVLLFLVLVFLMYRVATGLWTQWRYPPLIEINGQQLRVQMFGPVACTDVANIGALFMTGGHLCICLRDLQHLDPSTSKKTLKFLASQFQASGCHFVAPRGVFDLEQLNLFRRALGQTDQERDDRDQRLSDFEAGLKLATPRTWVTVTLILINSLIFVTLMIVDAIRSRSLPHIFESISPELIIDWGGNLPMLTCNGELWRLVTCMFLHWTLIHLLFNMWVLFDIGRLVERTFGSLPFLLIYLFSGLCGSLATVYWSSHGRPILSAGASGAVFGMFGLMLGMLRQRRRDFPAELLNEHKASCLGFVAYNLVLGISMPNVDIAAHLGGLAGGFLCGLVAKPILPPRPVPSLFTRLAILVPLCVGVSCAGILFLPHSGTNLSWELEKFLSVEQRLITRYENIISNKDDPKRTAEETVQLLQRDVIDPWRSERKHMATLANVRPEDRAAWKVILTYMTLREEGLELVSEAIRQPNDAKQMKAIEKFVAARALFENWVKTNGKRYGFSLSDSQSDSLESSKW